MMAIERGMEGPLFGALILGTGVGYLVTKKTGSLLYGIGAGLGVTLIDFVVLVWAKRLTARRRNKHQTEKK